MNDTVAIMIMLLIIELILYDIGRKINKIINLLQEADKSG
jgi:hypothetical protein